MGRYIEWDDVIHRYPALNTLGGSDEVDPAYIAYAEAEVDARLAKSFTIPFSNDNMTVRDLVIDDVYYRAGRFKFEDAIAVHSAYLESIGALIAGELGMVTTSGNLVSSAKAVGIYSSTQSYHSAFGMRPVEEQHIDPDNIEDERDLD